MYEENNEKAERQQPPSAFTEHVTPNNSSETGDAASENPSSERQAQPVPSHGAIGQPSDERGLEPEAEPEPELISKPEPGPEPELQSKPEPVSIKDQFDRPLQLAGEVQLPLNKLYDWDYHCAGQSRQSDADDAALRATAFTPGRMPPLEVIERVDGTYAVKDGRRRLRVLRDAYHNQPDTKVRCVIYAGTEEQAIEEMCEDALGKITRTPIETAIAVYNVHNISGVTQKAIAERYPGLDKDKVSRLIKAARIYKEYPVVFALLKDPDRVAIDTCVRIHDHMDKADDEKIGAFISRAEELAMDGVSFSTGELLEAFEIDGPAKKVSAAKADSFAPTERTEIFGDDDQVVGSLDMHSDDVARLRLPDPQAMTIEERAVAAKAFIKQIYAYFELDAD